MTRWEPDDLWQAHRDAIRDLYGSLPTRPTGPTAPLTAEEWARGRPDSLAPFWCRCGAVYHVRRHYDAHHCQARSHAA